MTVAPVERTPFSARTFAVVTAMSVVEHGVDIGRFFAEVARLLRPGGLCIISTDYWPHGAETKGLRRFRHIPHNDRVFSGEDIRALVREALDHGFLLLDEPGPTVENAPIESDGLSYTFLAIRLTRAEG
jgi:SAM-dependent methyltransferase